jgi:competence protein ComEA
MLKKLQQIKVVDGVIAGGIFLIIIGIGLNVKNNILKQEEVKVISKEATKETETKNDNEELTVDIEGEVLSPGIYSLKKGDRIGDLIAAASGLALNADRDWIEKNINKAALVYDGQKIYIPNKSESEKFKVESNGKISLNTAEVEELDKLSGIGPAMAQRIIDYRIKNGGFKSVEEIKLVAGVGDKLFEKIKEEICL